MGVRAAAATLTVKGIATAILLSVRDSMVRKYRYKIMDI